MSEFIQGGANFPHEGKATKTALKAALKANPTGVTLYATSDMGPQFNGPASSLPEGTTFNVVGPNPYRDRSWYASVKRGRNGLVCT
jgi:hypothetical protein